MKVCAKCGSEFQEGVSVCPDCGGVQWVSTERAEAEVKRAEAAVSHELDSHRFIRVDVADDPLTAEALEGALREARIPVFTEPRREGPVDPLTTGMQHGWFDILVPDTEVRRAMAVLEATREALEFEESSGEGERAAEAEEREQEGIASPS